MSIYTTNELCHWFFELLFFIIEFYTSIKYVTIASCLVACLCMNGWIWLKNGKSRCFGKTVVIYCRNKIKQESKVYRNFLQDFKCVCIIRRGWRGISLPHLHVVVWHGERHVESPKDTASYRLMGQDKGLWGFGARVFQTGPRDPAWRRKLRAFAQVAKALSRARARAFNKITPARDQTSNRVVKNGSTKG